MSKRNRLVVETEKLVGCLPGYENFNFQTKMKMTPKFYHKSGSELRLEYEQRTKLLPVFVMN